MPDLSGRGEKVMGSQHSVCTNPEGRGKLFERFVVGELGEWGRGQFTDHLVDCEFCQRKVMIHFLEPVVPTLPATERAVLQTAINQWRVATTT